MAESDVVEACELLRKTPSELPYFTARDRQLILHVLERGEHGGGVSDAVHEKLEVCHSYLSLSSHLSFLGTGALSDFFRLRKGKLRLCGASSKSGMRDSCFE